MRRGKKTNKQNRFRLLGKPISIKDKHSDSIVDIDNRFALAFEMVGKVFTAFPIGRLSSALATAHVHDDIGPSFYREIDKK